MRTHIAIVMYFCLTLVHLMYAESAASDLVRNIVTAHHPPNIPYDLKQLAELHNAVAGNHPNAWQMPEPLLNLIRAELEPLRPIVKDLGASQDKSERYYAAVFASYLEQDKDIKSLLYQLAKDEHFETAGTAIDAIFGFHLDTPALHGDITQALEADSQGHQSTLGNLAQNNVGIWRVTEAIPELMRRIKGTYDREHRIDGAVFQLKAFGQAANQALPLLRELLEKRKQDGTADFREIEALEHAILTTSGKVQKPTGLPPPEVPPSEAKLPSQASPPDVSMSKKPMSANTVKASSQAVQQSENKSWLMWLLVVIAATAGAAWLLLRKRK